jgi:ubiquinone biosynthesis protein COQ9
LRGLWINRRHSSDTTQDGSSSSREEDGTKQEDKIKNEILRASLPFVHKHGWTKNAISEGLKLYFQLKISWPEGQLHEGLQWKQRFSSIHS